MLRKQNSSHLAQPYPMGRPTIQARADSASLTGHLTISAFLLSRYRLCPWQLVSSANSRTGGRGLSWLAPGQDSRALRPLTREDGALLRCSSSGIVAIGKTPREQPTLVDFSSRYRTRQCCGSADYHDGR